MLVPAIPLDDLALGLPERFRGLGEAWWAQSLHSHLWGLGSTFLQGEVTKEDLGITSWVFCPGGLWGGGALGTGHS